ncbi:hypothetical protein ACHWQZ_G015080 [Mnemiopsis leidyi]
MSDLFSQFVSLVTPKYAKVDTQDPELHHPNLMQKNHFRATLSAEDRAKFFPETPTYPPPIKTSDKRSSSQTPLPPFGNTPEDLWDVDLDDEEIDEQILNGHVCENQKNGRSTKENVRREIVTSEKMGEIDNFIIPTEKSRPQIGDIFPTINEILSDHGLKEKLRDLTITVKNKLQKGEAVPTEEESEEGLPPTSQTNFFSDIRLPQPPQFLTKTSGTEKLYPLQQSKDKTVQTYFPGE